MEKITVGTKITKNELAVLLGVTGRWVRQLVEDGIITVDSDGKVPASAAVQQYITFQTSKSNSNVDDAELDKKKKEAETLLKESKAKIAKFEAAELEGKMHRSEDVEKLTEDLVYTIRSALMALPGRLAVDVVNCKTPAEASDFISREVHSIMRELADYHYDAGRYEELVRERMAWEADGDKDEE